MPIDVKRIRELISRNRSDILAVDEYFAHKIGAVTRYLYFWLEREGRTRDAKRLRGMATSKERVAWLRPRVERLPERSRFYARSIISEVDVRAEIELLDIYLPRIADPLTILKQSIALKTNEVDFCRDLLRSLLSYLPTQTRWIAEVERVLTLTLRRLDELRAMVGSLEGHVYDAETKEPIGGAKVEVGIFEIAGLAGTTNAEGYYRIDTIPADTYPTSCSADGYERQETRLEIKGGAVVVKDWFLKPIVVVPKVWRVHKAHMWYRRYKARVTPNPYAMISVFAYTRHPDDYPEELFDDALDFLERRGAYRDWDMLHPEEPSAFASFGLAEVSASPAALRRGYSPPGAYFKVEGIEREQVDEDELGDYEEDEIRYYVALYKIRGTEAYIAYEAWGKLGEVCPIDRREFATHAEFKPHMESEHPGVSPLPLWRIHAQDKKPPKWKKTEGLLWPEGLEL